jgi:hypothetical protein
MGRTFYVKKAQGKSADCARNSWSAVSTQLAVERSPQSIWYGHYVLLITSSGTC